MMAKSLYWWKTWNILVTNTVIHNFTEERSWVCSPKIFQITRQENISYKSSIKNRMSHTGSYLNISGLPHCATLSASPCVRLVVSMDLLLCWHQSPWLGNFVSDGERIFTVMTTEHLASFLSCVCRANNAILKHPYWLLDKESPVWHTLAIQLYHKHYTCISAKFFKQINFQWVNYSGV